MEEGPANKSSNFAGRLRRRISGEGLSALRANAAEIEFGGQFAG